MCRCMYAIFSFYIVSEICLFYTYCISIACIVSIILYHMDYMVFCNLYLQNQYLETSTEMELKVTVYLTLCQMFILRILSFSSTLCSIILKQKTFQVFYPLATTLYKSMFNCSEFILLSIIAMIEKDIASDPKINEHYLMNTFTKL